MNIHEINFYICNYHHHRHHRAIHPHRFFFSFLPFVIIFIISSFKRSFSAQFGEVKNWIMIFRKIHMPPQHIVEVLLNNSFSNSVEKYFHSRDFIKLNHHHHQHHHSVAL
jgi:hypothetical protein